MMVRRLLAKSSKRPDNPEERETLIGHTLAAMRVANAIVESQGNLYLQSLGLDPQVWENSLKQAAIRCAFLHDLGKANHQFQRMLRKGPDPPQALFHDRLSLWLPLRFPQLDAWLFNGCDGVTRQAALFAVAGHHLRFEVGSALEPRQGSGDTTVRMLTGHPDVRALFGKARSLLNASGSIPDLKDIDLNLLDDPLDVVKTWLPQAYGWWEEAKPEEKRFVPLVKALVVAADVASSALPREGMDPVQWSEKVLSRNCSPEDLMDLAQRKLGGKHPCLCSRCHFQEEVAESSARVTFVSAGCGTGKTLAAYLWASNRARGRKLFFCYPTTGTATEGYRDYVHPDDIEGRLIHSRAEVDLEGIMGNGDHTGTGLEEEQTKIEALSAWDVPLVVCTADTVLGLVQNYRRGLFQFPAIAGGAFVFDEVHAYDDRMFGTLLHFLKAFRGSPILLMTASLPRDRHEAIRRVLTDLGENMAEVQGPSDIEQLPRYVLSPPAADPPWPEVEKTLRAGGKVLWVANTVDRAVALAREARERGLAPVLPYHSRYRYIDRLNKHRAVVDAFGAGGPALAVTTQVCEVSLDLSADLLVSDMAPVPALIQRLGRLNRRAGPEVPGEPKRAIFLQPEKPNPYAGQELDVARRWLENLGAGPLSQKDIAQAFREMDGAPSVEGLVTSAWLDGGPFAAPSPLREWSATIPVVRGEDAAACKDWRGRVQSDQVVRYAIPMLLPPVAKEIRSWPPRLGMALVAPEGRIDYSEEWGATWRK
ncbi:MAG: CRISPR-associated helicase Cas3' [Halobacteria archaeon]